MVWGVSFQNTTNLSVSLTPNGNVGSADRFIQVDGYHSIVIQEVGDRVRRTSTTWAVVVYDGFHNIELGYEGGPTFNFVISRDPTRGIVYSESGRSGSWQLPILPKKTIADRSPVWIYTFISGLVIDVTPNSVGKSPSLQLKKPRSDANVATQLWVWTEGGQIVNASTNKCLSTDGTTITLVAYQAGAATIPAEQAWTRISSTGRIQSLKYPTKVLRADRPQLTTPPAGSKDAWGYGYNVGASLLLSADVPLWQPTFYDGPEMRDWCLIPPGFAQPIFSKDGLILDRVSTATSPDFNNLSPSRLWYHSRGLLVNDLDGQTLSVNPQNNKWYPIDKDVYNVQLVRTQSAFNQFGGTRWQVNGLASNSILNLQVDGPLYFSPTAQVTNSARVGTQATDWSLGNSRDWQWFRGPDLRNAAFIDLTVAPNGFLVGLTADKRLFYSSGNQIWKELAAVFNTANAKVANVSIGLPSMLYAMLSDGTVYKMADYNSNAVWTQLPSITGGAAYISCGVDNNVWAISTSRKVYTLDGSTASPAWVDVTSTSPANLVAVETGTRTSVWAIDTTGKAWRRDSLRNPPTWVNGGASNLASIQVGVDGSVFAVTSQQVVVRYEGTTTNTWQSLPGRVKSLAVASANLVIGASYVEGIYRYRPVPTTNSTSTTRRFKTLANSSEVKAQDAAASYGATIDEFIFCAGMANAVYDAEAAVRSYLTNLSFVTKAVIDDTATNTQAFVAWNSTSKILVVSFRGTEITSIADWITDLQQTESSSLAMLGDGPANGQVPVGFGTAYAAVRSNVWEAVKGVVYEAGIAQISKIYVTGHSLGGALATYCAADLAILLKAMFSFTNRNVLRMINFGAPYSANDAFYDFFTNGLASSLTSVAVINEKDVVPYISVPLYAWRRLGTPYTLIDPNYAVPGPLYSHSILTYSSLLSSQHNAFAATKSIEIEITTGTDSFGWFDKAGTDRAVSIVFGKVSQLRGHSISLPLPGTSKMWPLEKIVFDSSPEDGTVGTVTSLLTFEDDKTDTFSLDKPYLLDKNEVNGFVLCIDTSVSFAQGAAALLNFGTRDNWLVKGIKIKIDGAVRYNVQNTFIRLGPDWASVYADILLPIP